MGCHRSHTILKMVPPGKDGDWSPKAVRANYRAALRVVNLAQPADSLLLGKPTWEAAEEAEAQNDPTKKAHAGGVRFEQELARVPDAARLDQRRTAPCRCQERGEVTCLLRHVSLIIAKESTLRDCERWRNG